MDLETFKNCFNGIDYVVELNAINFKNCTNMQEAIYEGLSSLNLTDKLTEEFMGYVLGKSQYYIDLMLQGAQNQIQREFFDVFDPGSNLRQRPVTFKITSELLDSLSEPDLKRIATQIVKIFEHAIAYSEKPIDDDFGIFPYNYFRSTKPVPQSIYSDFRSALYCAMRNNLPYLRLMMNQ